MDPLHITLKSMSAVVIDIDSSFFIQLTLILLLMALLNKLIFQPFLKGVDDREAKTSKLKATSAEIKARAESLCQRYSKALEEARDKALDLRQALRQEATDQRRAQLESARSDADQNMKEAQEEMKLRFSALQGELQEEVEPLSKLVVEKILGSESR